VLAKHHGPPEGDGGCRGIHAELHPKRSSFLELLNQGLGRLDHIDAPQEDIHL
jgi:hypothetical protein